MDRLWTLLATPRRPPDEGDPWLSLLLLPTLVGGPEPKLPSLGLDRCMWLLPQGPGLRGQGTPEQE